MTINYRGYQKEGIKFLTQNYGAILGDDMGSGKTLQSLASSLFLYAQGEVDKILIVCPKSLVMNWKAEIAKFFNLECYIHTGKKRSVEKLLSEALIVTTYQTLVVDADQLPSKKNKQGHIYEFVLSDKLCVIVDEAHNVKNRSTNISQCLFALKNKYCWLMTGTPMHNKPEDVYGLLKICDKSLMNSQEWANMFYVYKDLKDKRGNQVYYFDKRLMRKVKAKTIASYKNLDTLSSLLRRYMLRREKKEILPYLPRHTRHVIPYQINADFETQLDLLKTKHKDQVALVGKTFELLQGVVNGKFTSNNKTELLKDLVNGTEDRVVVWTTHIAAAQGLCNHFRNRETFIHTGEMSIAQQNEAIKSWQKTESAILIMTIKSGGTGLNLVEASTQVFYGMSYNASDNDQAEARLHRSGQRNEVNTYYLIGHQSLEEKLWALIQNKRKFAESLYSGEAIEDLYNIILKL